MRLHPLSSLAAMAAVAGLSLAGNTRAAVLVVADDGMGSAANCNDATPAFTSINAAIAAAVAGDTIKVCPGTYVENVVLNKNVILQGAMAGVPACGRAGAETIIKPAVATSPTLLINNALAAGATVDGFTFDGNGGTPANGCVDQESAATPGLQIKNNRILGFKSSGLWFARNCTDCLISGNEIDGSTMVGNGQLLFLSTNSYNGIQILNNCLHNSANYGIFVDGNRNVGVGLAAPLMSGNTISSCAGSGMNSGSRSFQSITVSNNTFSNNGFDGWQGGPKDSFITNNQFINNGRSGLALTSFGNATAGRGAINTPVTNNKFLGNGFLNTGEGLFVSSTQPIGNLATTPVNNNIFIGNRVGLTCNLLNTSTDTLDATNNYWGAASGPADSAVAGDNAANPSACPSIPLSNASGTGDSVRSTTGTFDAPRVNYCPWTLSLPGAALVTAQTCYKIGDHIIVLINTGATPVAAAGGQFFLSFDSSKLSYNGGLPGDGSNVYTTEILDSSPAAGQVDYAVGVTFGSTGLTAGATMARLDFTATANICAGSGLVAFRSHNPPTRLTDSDGNAIAGTYFDLGAITIDSTAPTITCPSSPSVNADAGLCTHTFTSFPPATATDNCTSTPSIAISYQRSDNPLLTLADPFPTGMTTVTWSATDCSGNIGTCNQTVTVNASNTLNATVQEAGLAIATTRCITFELWRGCSLDATVSADLSFNGSGTATAAVDVPCGALYTSITVRDAKHSLRRTSAGAANFGTSGVDYYATFTSGASKALELGNLNDDPYVDILDAGVFFGRYGNIVGPSTCGFAGSHADIDSDGSVGTGDFTFIQSAFLHFRDLDPCGGALADGGPITDISVDEAMARGLRDVAMIDFNLDGRVNAADIAWVAANGLPRCIADFNDDQFTDVNDIFAYLNAWFMGHPRSDTNANGVVEVQDIFSFINVWFQGC